MPQTGTAARGGGDALPHEGPLPGADSAGESGSMTAGPGVRFALRLDDEARIADVRFETAAFPAARPVASALCRAILGTTVEQASAVTVRDVALAGGVPERSPAARTVHFAKSAALLPLLGRRARHGPALTCACFHVPTDAIRAAIREHRLTTVDEVRARTKAGSGCGTCRPDVARLVAEEGGAAP